MTSNRSSCNAHADRCATARHIYVLVKAVSVDANCDTHAIGFYTPQAAAGYMEMEWRNLILDTGNSADQIENLGPDGLSFSCRETYGYCKPLEARLRFGDTCTTWDLYDFPVTSDSDTVSCFPRLSIDQTKTLETAIATYGISPQSDMVIEEMSELTKAILKLRRNEHNIKRGACLQDLCEETADVFVMLAQLLMMHKCTNKVQHIFNQKIARLQQNLEKEKKA